MPNDRLRAAACSGLPDKAAAGTFVLGEAGLEACDATAGRLWGHTSDAILGKTLLELSPEHQPDGSASATALKARIDAARQGLAQSFEWQFRGSDEQLIDTLVCLEQHADSRRHCLLGRVRDLRQLHDAESALRESETRLRQILDNTTAIVFVKDRAGRHLFANRQFQRLFGLQETEILGRRDTEIFPPAVAEAFSRNDQQVLTQGQAVEFEERARLPEGERVYISIKFPLFNAEGEPYGVCGIATDITERKRTEEALRTIALGVSGTTGSNTFAEIARHLAAALDVDFAFVGKLVEGHSGRAQTVATYHNGSPIENFEYDLVGTPCQEVVGHAFQYIPWDVGAHYPGDNLFKELGLQSYAGFPLFDSRGRALGLIAVSDRKPLRDRGFTESMLKIFSVRAAAELERLRAEEARYVSELSYREIFEAAEDAIFVHDFDTGAIVDVNPKACAAYGYTAEEFKQIEIGQLGSGVHPYTQEEAVKYVEKAKAGLPQRVEWHRRNKDGSLRWDEVYLRRATIGGVPRIIAVTRDITERKEREEALRKSEDRLRATVEAALDCIIGMDAKGNIIEFNPAAEDCFGCTRAQVLGRSLAEVMIPERLRGAHQDGLARYLKSGKGPFVGRRVEVTAQRADGTEFPAELAIDVAQGAEGHIFIGYLRDITARQRAEAERARLEAQLRQAQKMEAIGHLTGGIAHDFNNILTGVMGYIVLAQEVAERHADPKLAKYLERAQQSGQRARDLIQQMLTFSRGQRGEPRALALAPLLKESVKLLGSTLPSSVELHTEFADTPPVLLDPVQVEQVLMNLCINARDAMQAHGRIEIRLHEATLHGAVCSSCHQAVEGRFIELAVHDSGPGVAPEIATRIFDPFFSTKGVGKGSGMGLSTVHGIVHEYGGHIIMDSVPGDGATFRVLFKPMAGAAGAVRALSAESGPIGLSRALSGRVLVVDDDEMVGEFMGDLLGSWGMEVAVVRSGLEARDLFAADPHRFDLAVLDQTMPRMTGLELAKHLLAIRRDLPVILYTGYSEALSKAQLHKAGVRTLIRKPVDPDILFESISELLPPGRVSGGPRAAPG